MAIYDEIGVRPFINAGGWMYTRYGGSIMPEAVVAAMAEASKRFVNLFDLQDRMGKAIAKMTQNESAFISGGAASGILLCVATCIAGTDAEMADRLPQTEGMRNQVIMRHYDRGTEADPAIRAAGGMIVEAGAADSPAGAEKILDAINEHTAAILLIAFESEPEVADVGAIVKGARERNIPVLIDGAYSLPPKENLWRYTRDLGVDAFITSGGKAIRGPQSTGLVLGKQRIIEGCKYHASPNLRIGRGMKVGKEEFAGIYTALKLFLARDTGAQAAANEKQLACILECVRGIHGLTAAADGSQLNIDFDPAKTPGTAETAARMMLAGDPSILLRGRGNRITVRASLLQPGEEQIVGDRLRQVLSVVAAGGA